MRPGPATQAALLSRMLLLPSFARNERQSRNCTPKRAMQRGPPEVSHSRLAVQRFHSALRRISEEAATPGHQLTGHEPEFPRRFTLEKIAGNAELRSAALRNILAL